MSETPLDPDFGDESYVVDLPDDPQPGNATAGEMPEDVSPEDEALAAQNPPDDGGA